MLTLVLETPTVGMVSPPVVDGSLEYVLDRYPRMSLSAELRPDPSAMHLWQSPYGTRAHVLKPDGSMMFSGPVHSSQVSRPDGRWTIQAADDSSLLRLYRTGNRPGQFLAGSTMNVAGFIQALAALAGVTIRTSGGGGNVDVRELDIASAEAWSLVEEQLIANNLDVWPRGDGTLYVGETASMKPQADHVITVGETGTLTGYTLTMSRVYNRVVLTYEASKQGESEQRYVDGVWTDSTSSAGTKIGVNPYTRTVRVGADWWDNPSGHQAEANAAAAAVAQAVRGWARAATIETVPNYTIQVGDTVLVTFMAGVTDRFLVTAATWPLSHGGAVGLEIRNPNPDWAGSTFFAEEVQRARIDT